MSNLYRFIRTFLMYWNDYPMYKAFCQTHIAKEQMEEMKKADEMRGVESHDENRFDYAWHLSKIWWGHRDRYSKKCTGDCENCNLKHC